ncbi:MAG TPA: RNA polymerase sigma factor SigW [Bacilli bacterium]
MNVLETRLAKLAKRGDRNAFSELVRLYSTKIFHLAYRMLNNRQEAEDVVQDTCLRVYRNLDKYDPEQRFSTWIYRIATNLCIDRLRRRKGQYSLDADLPEGDGLDWHSMLASEERGPESSLLLSETQAKVRKAINTLPQKYKAVVVLRYLQDLSLQEISEILGLPVTTIKTRVHRGREYLRKKLEEDHLI